MQVKIQQLELDMKQQTGYKSGKEYVESGSIAQVPKSAARQKNEKHKKVTVGMRGPTPPRGEGAQTDLMSALLYIYFLIFIFLLVGG